MIPEHHHNLRFFNSSFSKVTRRKICIIPGSLGGLLPLPLLLVGLLRVAVEEQVGHHLPLYANKLWQLINQLGLQGKKVGLSGLLYNLFEISIKIESTSGDI
jgi:hypothetical protein